MSYNYTDNPPDSGLFHTDQFSYSFLIYSGSRGPKSGTFLLLHSLSCSLRINPSVAFFSNSMSDLVELYVSALSLSAPSVASSFALWFSATILCSGTQQSSPPPLIWSFFTIHVYCDVPVGFLLNMRYSYRLLYFSACKTLHLCSNLYDPI